MSDAGLDQHVCQRVSSRTVSKSNPTGANERPVIGRALNCPTCDLFVDPDACGQANRYDCGITGRSSNGQFAGERMNPSRKNREHNTCACRISHPETPGPGSRLSFRLNDPSSEIFRGTGKMV